MKTASFKSSSNETAALAEAKFQIVAAYEDFQTGARVRNVLRHLLDEGCEDIGSTTAFWKFELLNYPPLFDQAVSEAAEAEFIIISVHGNSELPESVAKWIEHWTPQRIHPPRLLLTLLDECSEYAVIARALMARLNSLASARALEWIPIFSDSGDLPVFAGHGATHKA